MADMEYVGRGELSEVDHRLTKEIKENRANIEENSKNIARLEAVYKSLEGLPLTITNLDKTMTVISGNLSSMEKNLSSVEDSVSKQAQAIEDLRAENMKQNDSLEKIDNKSKVDILLFAKENFWKLLSALAVGYAVIEIIMKRVGG